MAKFSATTTVLFCLFTLSLAVTPLNTPENDDVTNAVSLPDADPTTSNPSVPINADENPLPLSTVASTSVPLTTISFLPINRRFSKFPCHRHKFFKPDPARPLETPYSNDMVVSSGENSDFQDPETLHEVKPHHHRHHDEDSDSDSDSESDSDSDDEDGDDRIGKMVLRRRHFGRLDAEKLEKLKQFRHEHPAEHKHHHKKKNSFMIRVRKFFEHYF